MTEEMSQELAPKLSDAVDFARRVLNFNLDWYKNADTKAEIILSLDGIFLAFITSFIFKDEAEKILANFSIGAWLSLGLMLASLAGSIFCAIACLWSRISLTQIRRKKEKYVTDQELGVDQLESYQPEMTFFFQKISSLDRDLYQKLLLSVDKEFEIKALAVDVHTLSGNVLLKHLFVDVSFTLAGTSLLSFLALGIFYLVALIGSQG